MIDLNRGVTMRIHPQGFHVCMYKDQPGVYMDIDGRPLDDKIAKEAGFPVEKHAKDRVRRQKLADAIREINAEFGEIAKGEAVFEYEGYSVVHQGDGAFAIKDPDGAVMPSKPLSKADAVKLVKQLAQAEKKAADDKETN